MWRMETMLDNAGLNRFIISDKFVTGAARILREAAVRPYLECLYEKDNVQSNKTA